MITLADAVVDPGTVVIHAPNATLANATVVGSRRPVRFAPGTDCPIAAVAITGRVVLVGGVVVREVQAVGGQRHGPGIGEYCLRVGHS